MSNKKIIIAALIFGLITAFAVYYYLQQAKAELNNVQTYPVLVAKAAIPAKTTLKPGMIEIKNIPRAYIHPQALVELKAAADKVTIVEITAGEQILGSRLVSTKDTGSGLSYVVPEGLRAISVGVNAVTGVSSLLQTGDEVDVVGLMEVDNGVAGAPAGGTAGGKTSTSVAKIIMQKVTILAIDQKLERVKATAEGKEGAPPATTTITLAVKPEDVEKLVLISERGVISLVLRSPVDQGKYVPKTYSPKDFMIR